MDYTDIADVLDSVASYVDGLESEKQAAETEARSSRIDKIAARYETATGEDVPEGIKTKLAGLDPDTLDTLLKVANNNNEDDVTSLGGPGIISTDNRSPTSVKEAADQAEDRFLSWIIE